MLFAIAKEGRTNGVKSFFCKIMINHVSTIFMVCSNNTLNTTPQHDPGVIECIIGFVVVVLTLRENHGTHKNLANVYITLEIGWGCGIMGQSEHDI